MISLLDHRRFCVLSSALALCLGTLSISARALAASDDDSDADDTETLKTPEKPGPSAGEALPVKAKAAPEKAEAEEPAPLSLGPVERLPGSAYPQWTTRGLYGGSLWLTMHGMPWPYYPKTGIGVSGSAWIDGGYESIKRGNPSEASIKYLVNQSRAVLRVSPTYSKGSFYVQSQAEIVGNGDQSVPQPTYVSTDDLWVRTGEWKQWDLQLGRFEAFEVYHFGMGMDLNTLERQGPTDQRALPDVPGLNPYVYRQNGIGNVAFHVYPSSALRFELLAHYGFASAEGLDAIGARPAAILDLGFLKFKVAGDIRKQFPVSSLSKEQRFQRGGSAALQFVFDPYVEFGGNIATELVDHYNPQNTADQNASRGDYDGLGSVTDFATGGFCNVHVVDDLLLGGGINYVRETDQVQGIFTNTQGFGAIQYIIAKQLFVKLVGAYAKAHIQKGGELPYENTMVSGRLRVMYLF